MYTKEDYTGFFQEADSDKSGSLSLGEMKETLSKHGYSLSEDQLKLMFKVADTSGDGEISFDEYMEAMGSQPSSTHGSAAMRLVFVKFDTNNDGKIDRAELGEVFKSMGKELGDEELTKAMARCDDDKSGDIDYEEFLRHFFNVDC